MRDSFGCSRCKGEFDEVWFGPDKEELCMSCFDHDLFFCFGCGKISRLALAHGDGHGHKVCADCGAHQGGRA